MRAGRFGMALMCGFLACGLAGPAVAPVAGRDGVRVTVDAARSVGPADRAASGILHSVGPGPSQAYMGRLGVTAFRDAPSCCSGGLDWSRWDAATASGSHPATTLILSDLWSEGQAGRPATPWSNWAAYSHWVAAAVRYLMWTGRSPDYWEVYNEPDQPDAYYPAAEAGSVTTGRLLEQFLVAYRAITSVDARARVVGPSLSRFDARPGGKGPGPDLAAFVAFAAANHLHPAALTWHENGFGPASAIVSHVAVARRLLAAHPSMRHVAIDINEYGAPGRAGIPGWDVGYLSALTAARVRSAGRSCWADCWTAGLDGLLTAAGRPRPAYYVNLAYAHMTGSMVATSTSAGQVAALGAWDPARRRLTALVGRGVGCTQTLYCALARPWDSRRRPVPVTVRVVLPQRSRRVEVRVSDISGSRPLFESGGPRPVSDLEETSSPHGRSSSEVTVRIPDFADGDAYTIRITSI